MFTESKTTRNIRNVGVFYPKIILPKIFYSKVMGYFSDKLLLDDIIF